MSEPQRKTKIAFVINSIGQGGAERVLSVILSAIGERAARYEVHLILLDDLPHARAMPDHVVLHTLGGGVSSVFQLLVLARKIRPSLIVSFLIRANLASALAGRVLGIPVIVCERMHLSSHLAAKYPPVKQRAFLAALRFAYRFPQLVLGVSTGVTEDLIATLGIDRRRTATIFNPYPMAEIRAAAGKAPPADLPKSYFVCVGRLEPAKNVPQLLEAYKASAISQALVIVGDGSARKDVQDHIVKLGLEGRVQLLGFCANPFPIVEGAEAYVSASLNEGFPNAMVEAMVLGRPILASDCPAGPAEILDGSCRVPGKACEGRYGVLTCLGDEASLVDGLRRMAATETRAYYGQQARERASHFNAEKITEQYWATFDRISAGGSPGINGQVSPKERAAVSNRMS